MSPPSSLPRSHAQWASTVALTEHIDQWMEVFCAASGGNQVTITYPIAFTTSANKPRLQVQDPSLTGATAQNFIYATLVSSTLTQCVVAFGLNGGSARDITLCVDVKGK